METLVFLLAALVGTIGTWFLVYFLKTQKLLKTQHKLILDMGLALIGKDLAEIKRKEEAEKVESCEAKKKPCKKEKKEE